MDALCCPGTTSAYILLANCREPKPGAPGSFGPWALVALVLVVDVVGHSPKESFDGSGSAQSVLALGRGGEDWHAM